jgi:hypothetical protein
MEMAKCKQPLTQLQISNRCVAAAARTMDEVYRDRPANEKIVLDKNQLLIVLKDAAVNGYRAGVIDGLDEAERLVNQNQSFFMRIVRAIF